MRIVRNRQRLLATSMIAGFAVMAAAVPAVAQDASQDAQLDEIVVTGSRIPQANLVTTSPVTQVTGEDIDVAGVTRVEDLVNQLPQAFAAQNSTVSNGATGTATVSLRNLGATRTLVLVDGRRLGYGSPNSSPADLNQIPGQLVERVEVLTGGASAVYGSDALAGVVNFIMRRDFEGVQLDAQYGFYQHNNDYDGVGNLRNVISGRAATNPAQFRLPADDVNDGFSKEATLLLGIGTEDGRGNATAYISYRNNDPILQGERDYSACALGGFSGANFTCGGSGTSNPGLFITGAGSFTVAGPSGVGAGTFVPFNAATGQYNFGPLNYYQRPDERYSFGTFARYEINDKVEIYSDLMFTDYSSVAQIAPSGVFGNTSSINCGNPLLSAQQRTTIGCTAAQIAADSSIFFIPLRRNTEGGGRQDDIGYQSFRGVIGARGDLNEAWSYDIYAQYSRVELQRTYRNDFSVSRLTRALDVVDTDPGPGVTATCRSVVNGTDPGCVPYNIFSTNSVSAAALAYVQIPLVQTGETSTQIISGSLTGDLGAYGWQSPWASRPIGVALGLEYRRDDLATVSDVSFATGDGAGQGGPTIGLSGNNDVMEAFGEIQIPLISDRPGIYEASIDFAYRYSDYELGGNTDTYKVGADYAPVEDLRFRASYQRAVRAPSIIELFAAQGFNLFDMDDDPCDATDPNGDGVAPAANCQGGGAHQVTPGESTSGVLTSPAGQYNFLAGGSPALNPEEAVTYTIGAVFQPSFIPGLNVSIDYFNIEIEQLVATVGPLNTINACYFNGVASACNLITRDGGTGSLWLGTGVVSNLNTNIGGLATSGFDFNAGYSKDLADWGWDNAGSINLTFVGTLLDSLETNTGLGFANSVYDCAGFFGNQCGTPNPEWRHRARLAWSTPWGPEISGTWRHYGEVEIAVLGTTNGSLNNGGARIDRYFDSYNYFDLAATWQVRDDLRVRAGMNNVFDSDPPLSYSVGTTGNGNTYPQLYDALGRYVFFGITADF